MSDGQSEVIDISPGLALQSTVALPVTVDEAISQWEEYQELTRRLLDNTDYQKMGARPFKKKSAWRKYARAFNISDRVTFEEVHRDEDGFPIWARIRVEAYHPATGRRAEADHECHKSERCCPSASGNRCPKESWDKHTCCVEGCNGKLHYAHPGDVPATALTRAKNRAISDLIGAGEVSAEEMSGQRSAPEADVSDDGGNRARRPPATRKPASVGAVPHSSAQAPGQFGGSPAQPEELRGVLKEHGPCSRCDYEMPKGTTVIYNRRTKTQRHEDGACPPEMPDQTPAPDLEIGAQ